MHGQVSECSVNTELYLLEENKRAKTAQHQSCRCVCYHLSSGKCVPARSRFDRHTFRAVFVLFTCSNFLYFLADLIKVLICQMRQMTISTEPYQTKEQRKLHPHKLSFPKRSENYWLISNQTPKQHNTAHLPQNWQIGGKLFLPYWWRWNIKLIFNGKVWFIFWFGIDGEMLGNPGMDNILIWTKQIGFDITMSKQNMITSHAHYWH